MYYFTIFLTDLGANIGAFTLAVAAMGRKVKAVDAGFENLSYMRYIQTFLFYFSENLCVWELRFYLFFTYTYSAFSTHK